MAGATEDVMTPLLAGRRALVTGAASGIGRAVCAALVAAGEEVVATDLVPGSGIRQLDVTDEGAVAAVFAEQAGAGAIDDVVHAAGIVSIGTVEETTVETFRRVLEVNLVGSFIVARAAAKHLRSSGNLILIASQAGLKAGALWGAYGASKGGLLRLADALTEELADRGIRVNCISPGNVDTVMAEVAMTELAQRRGTTLDAVRAAYKMAIPMRRFARPGEIGATVVALCSPLMSYVDGANIVVDGGELSR